MADWTDILMNGTKPADVGGAFLQGQQQNMQMQQAALQQQIQHANFDATQGVRARYIEALKSGDVEGAANNIAMVDAPAAKELYAGLKQHHDYAAAQQTAVGQVANAVLALPSAARRAAIQAAKPGLVSGFGVDPTAIDQIANIADDGQLNSALIAARGVGYAQHDQNADQTARLEATKSQVVGDNALDPQTGAIRYQGPIYHAHGIEDVVDSSPAWSAAGNGNAPGLTATAPQTTGAAAPGGGRFDPRQFFKDFTAPHEGGYNPHDANGAPVNFGINQAANPNIDVRNMTKDQAAQIFAEKYAAKAANMSPALGAAYADTAFINPRAADRFLQRSNGDPTAFLALRKEWQDRLVAGDPGKYGKYARAWTTRTADLASYISRLPQDQSASPVMAAAAPVGSTGIQTPNGAPMTGTAPQGDPMASQSASMTSVAPQSGPMGATAPNGGPPQLQTTYNPGPNPARDPGMIDNLAETIVRGGQLPAMGRGGQLTMQLAQARAAQIMKERGMTAGDIVTNAALSKADRDAIGNLQATASVARSKINSMTTAAQNLLKYSDALRGQTWSPTLNKYVNEFGEATGDPRVAQAGISYKTFIDEYAALTQGKGGTMTDAARHSALETMNSNASPEVKRATIQAMFKDAYAVADGVDKELHARTQHLSQIGAPRQNNAASAPQPTPYAIKRLHDNPQMRGLFDQTYGRGASARVLGQ